jgi:hypothetical protein
MREEKGMDMGVDADAKGVEFESKSPSKGMIGLLLRYKKCPSNYIRWYAPPRICVFLLK